MRDLLFQSSILLIFQLLFALKGFGQSEKDAEVLERYYAKLDSIDYDALQTDLFLNKGFFFGQGLNRFRSQAEKERQVVFTNASRWKSFYIGYRKAIRPEKANLPGSISNALNRYKNKENVVPIGILQAQGNWLEGYEIDENINAKRNGFQMSKEYETLNIFEASVLRHKVYDAEVTFEVVASLYRVEDKDIVLERRI